MSINSIGPNESYNEARFRQKRFLLVIAMSALLFLVLASSHTPIVTAQTQSTPSSVACSQIVPQALKNISASCNDLGRNQVCYANNSLSVAYLDTGAPAAPATAAATAAVGVGAPGPSSAGPLAHVGDITSLNTIKSITAAPLNTDTGEWGLAVLKVQAKVPGATSGQAVTFVLYGDTHLRDLSLRDPNAPAPTPFVCPATTLRATYLRSLPDLNSQRGQLLPANTAVNLTGRTLNNAWALADYQGTSGWLSVANNLRPTCDVTALMPAGQDTPAALDGSGSFYFSTGIGVQAQCNDVPAAGLLIQAPTGTRVTFRANGADITIASTVMLTADPNSLMTLYVLEGTAWMRSAGQDHIATTGQQMTVPLGSDSNAGITDGLQVIGPPSSPLPLKFDNKNTVPTACQLALAAGLRNPCTPSSTNNNNTNIGTRAPTRAVPTRPGPTFTPTAAGQSTVACQIQGFSANPNPAPYGKSCTTLSWGVEGVNSVYLNGAGVVGHGSKQVCIQNPTTYTLVANCPDGTTKSASVNVGIQPG